MVNLLENLEVTKIAFVDEGDNPEARLLFTKRKDNGPEDPKPEDPKPEQDPEPEGSGDEPEPNPEQDTGSEGGEKSTGKQETIKRRGEIVDMKFDTTKMTPEQLEQFEEIKKTALINEPEGEKNEPEGGEDIYKDMHPEVKKRLEAMQKRMDEMEAKEMHEVAKRYEIIGEKPDELAPKLLSIKKENPQAYTEMIAVMDKTKAMVEKAGVFSEIGKTGAGDNASDSDAAWKKIEKHAEEIIKAKPTMTFAEACDAAAAQHPELVHEYESNL